MGLIANSGSEIHTVHQETLPNTSSCENAKKYILHAFFSFRHPDRAAFYSLFIHLSPNEGKQGSAPFPRPGKSTQPSFQLLSKPSQRPVQMTNFPFLSKRYRQPTCNILKKVACQPKTAKIIPLKTGILRTCIYIPI